MIQHFTLTPQRLRQLIRRKAIMFAGNMPLKIYGTLHCSSGKRMKQQNRIFFSTEEEAVAEGYRPCGHCLREKYLLWKQQKTNG